MRAEARRNRRESSRLCLGEAEEEQGSRRRQRKVAPGIGGGPGRYPGSQAGWSAVFLGGRPERLERANGLEDSKRAEGPEVKQWAKRRFDEE